MKPQNTPERNQLGRGAQLQRAPRLKSPAKALQKPSPVAAGKHVHTAWSVVRVLQGSVCKGLSLYGFYKIHNGF